MRRRGREDQRLYANQPIGECAMINMLIDILWSVFLNMCEVSNCFYNLQVLIMHLILILGAINNIVHVINFLLLQGWCSVWSYHLTSMELYTYGNFVASQLD